MGILKRNPDKTLSPEMGYWKYLLFEYFGAYDDGSLETRLKALQVGWIIFSREGKAAYEFVEFHKNKRRVLGDVLKYFYVIVGLGGFVLLLYVFNAPFFFALLAFVPPIIIHLLAYKPRLKQNLRHVTYILENSQLFTQLIDLPVGDEAALQAFMESLKVGNKVAGERKNHTKAHEAFSDDPISDFQMQLLEISKRENQFNKMPMREVIDYFSMLCCPACRSTIPQMTESDFLLFLKGAFLSAGLAHLIRLDRQEVGITQEIFHQFMRISTGKFYDQKKGVKAKYVRLLTDYFEGFEFEKIAHNFRTNEEKRIPNIRNQYKNEIQQIHRLHDE